MFNFGSPLAFSAKGLVLETLILRDTNIIDFNKLLDIFWDIHDPTQINRQGVDIGTQYRSCIFTDYEPYIDIAKSAIDALNTSKRYNNPISTILYENVTFFEAENYHQKYLFR